MRNGVGCGMALGVEWRWVWNGAGCGMALGVEWRWMWNERTYYAFCSADFTHYSNNLIVCRMFKQGHFQQKLVYLELLPKNYSSKGNIKIIYLLVFFRENVTFACDGNMQIVKNNYFIEVNNPDTLEPVL